VLLYSSNREIQRRIQDRFLEAPAVKGISIKSIMAYNMRIRLTLKESSGLLEAG
jgi:hypothetical protein